MLLPRWARRWDRTLPAVSQVRGVHRAVCDHPYVPPPPCGISDAPAVSRVTSAVNLSAVTFAIYIYMNEYKTNYKYIYIHMNIYIYIHNLDRGRKRRGVGSGDVLALIYINKVSRK